MVIHDLLFIPLSEFLSSGSPQWPRAAPASTLGLPRSAFFLLPSFTPQPHPAVEPVEALQETAPAYKTRAGRLLPALQAL